MADAAHAGRTRRDFGTMPDGRPVHEHTLDNGRGLVVRVINLGGIVTALHCPDRDGYSANVVLGLPTLSDYVERNPNFGILVGRYANRIAEGRFTLDGRVHRLTQNDGSNALHGGTVHTYDDHRIAMAFSLIGLRIPGIRIENPVCVAKTFPDFFEKLECLRQ